MSQLSKSLEKRIQELTASIESHKIELAAYERVLHLELSNDAASAETDSVTPEIALAVSSQKKAIAAETVKSSGPARVSRASSSGNKTSLVAEIVKSHGSAGATPKDVDIYFSKKNIPRSQNLVYNTLSYLVARKRLVRRDGRYFVMGSGATPVKKRSAKKAVGAKRTVAAKKVAGTKKAAGAKKATGVKRKISPEGLMRIKEALKRRWAAKRAADAAAKTK